MSFKLCIPVISQQGCQCGQLFLFMIIIKSILLIASLFCAISIFYSTIVYGVSPMPTSKQVKQVILDLLNRYNAGYRIYELGSGWGTLTSSISGAFPDYQVTGFERSPLPFLFSVAANKILNRKNCQLKYKDFFRTSFAETDIIVCYLGPNVMSRLKPKLEKELKHGSVVISSTFAVPGWQPIETITSSDLYHSKVYLYRKNDNSTSSLAHLS